jgi:CHAT domain-containing protein
MTSLLRPPAPSGRPADAPWTALAIGGPAVSSSVQATLAETMPGWRLRPHEEAQREARRIGEQLAPGPVSVIGGEDATESAVRAALSAADAVHVASPFRVNSASPLFSPMLLAPEGEDAGAGSDGALELEEVMKLRLRARATVLGDPAALSMRDAADEAATVFWAWRAAGVPALIVARWAGGEASDALLTELLRRLAAGESPGDALHAARAVVRTNERFAAPHHWAGWLLIGW